jgi:hypothetical protein
MNTLFFYLYIQIRKNLLSNIKILPDFLNDDKKLNWDKMKKQNHF